MLGVVLLSERAVDLQQLRRADLEPAPLETPQDFAGELSPDGIGLDQDKGLLEHSGAGLRANPVG